LISAYRFGFNGKENDDEAYGDDNQQDYGMRVYDPRLGRFLSVDPIAAQYPMLSSYQFASNSPVQAIDLDGLERMHYTRVSDENGKPRLEQIGQEDIVDRVVVSYRSSVSAYNDGAVPVYANKTNERQEHVVHQVRTGYVDGVDGGLGGPKEVQYDVTYTYKTYDNALNDVGGEKGWEEFLYRLMQGASFAHSENKANGGAGMAVVALQSGRGKTANAVAKVLSAEQKAAQAGAKAVEDATLDMAASGAAGGAKGVTSAFSLTKHGELTNGVYTVSKEAMKKHVFDLGQGKSIFYPSLNAEEAVLKAAQYADEAGLWIGNKAKVPVLNTNIGRLGNDSPTNVINVYRNSNGFIHGSPGTIR
jgi:RHS repeat-associated protein